MSADEDKPRKETIHDVDIWEVSDDPITEKKRSSLRREMRLRLVGAFSLTSFITSIPFVIIAAFTDKVVATTMPAYMLLVSAIGGFVSREIWLSPMRKFVWRMYDGFMDDPFFIFDAICRPPFFLSLMLSGILMLTVGTLKMMPVRNKELPRMIDITLYVALFLAVISFRGIIKLLR